MGQNSPYIQKQFDQKHINKAQKRFFPRFLLRSSIFYQQNNTIFKITLYQSKSLIIKRKSTKDSNSSFAMIKNNEGLLIENSIIFIVYMQKAIKVVNCDSIKPTLKPTRQRLSHLTDPSPHPSSRKQPYNLPDSINDYTALTPHNASDLREHPLYGDNHDLASSFSFQQEDNEYEPEKLLFAKLLQAKGQTEWLLCLHEMSQFDSAKPIDFIRIGEDEASIRSNKALAHHLGVWVISMGYKEPETRRKVILNIGYLFPEEQNVEKVGGELFDRMLHGYLPEGLQVKVLLQLCRRGWQYFSFFLARFIRLLQRYRQLGQSQFLHEVERAILPT